MIKLIFIYSATPKPDKWVFPNAGNFYLKHCPQMGFKGSFW